MWRPSIQLTLFQQAHYSCLFSFAHVAYTPPPGARCSQCSFSPSSISRFAACSTPCASCPYSCSSVDCHPYAACPCHFSLINFVGCTGGCLPCAGCCATRHLLPALPCAGCFCPFPSAACPFPCAHSLPLCCLPLPLKLPTCCLPSS